MLIKKSWCFDKNGYIISANKNKFIFRRLEKINQYELLKETKDVLNTENDLNKCIEYEKRIWNGENILLEANTFAINKILEISVKSPEIILVNQVTPNNNPIIVDSVLVTLATVK